MREPPGVDRTRCVLNLVRRPYAGGFGPSHEDRRSTKDTENGKPSRGLGRTEPSAEPPQSDCSLRDLRIPPVSVRDEPTASSARASTPWNPAAPSLPTRWRARGCV